MKFQVGQFVTAKETFDVIVKDRHYEIEKILLADKDEQLLFLRGIGGGYLSFRFVSTGETPVTPAEAFIQSARIQVNKAIKQIPNDTINIFETFDGTQAETLPGDSTMTLPSDSKTRKDYPLLSGCLNYFPAALAGVALISKKGNDKHNPGEEMHHARSKSMDHGDCILRHLMDVQDLLAQDKRSALTPTGIEQLKEEVSCLAWRALAYSQEIHETLGAPMAPGARP